MSLMQRLSVTKAQALAWMAEHDDMRLQGAGWQEEVYTHQVEGTFATAKLRKVIEAMERDEPEAVAKLRVRYPITPELIASHHADVSEERIAQMPLRVAQTKPVIWGEMLDGTHILLDGNHRLQKLIRAGETEGIGYAIPNELVNKFRVKVEFRRCNNGEWEEMSPEMDLALMVGEFPHHAKY